MKDVVDTKFRDQQAGFRKDRSYMDQIATLRIIREQSLEWNSPLFINFVDLEKAFDSVDRDTLWKLLRHHGVPVKFVNIIRSSYEGLSCRVIHRGQPTEACNVRTGVRQSCLLLPFLFLIAIDWVMRTDLALQTKIRVFNSNVKPVLLYGSETWRTTVATTKKVQTFINSYLRRILWMRWQITKEPTRRLQMLRS